MLRSALNRIGKALLRPIWVRVLARIESRIQPIEIKLNAIEIRLNAIEIRLNAIEMKSDALSEREAEHADALYRRMYLAELEGNHVPVLDREVRDLSQRIAVLEDAWRANMPSHNNPATLSNLPASARNVYSELRAAIVAKVSNN
jgi:hypothetical protein